MGHTDGHTVATPVSDAAAQWCTMLPLLLLLLLLMMMMLLMMILCKESAAAAAAAAAVQGNCYYC